MSSLKLRRGNEISRRSLGATDGSSLREYSLLVDHLFVTGILGTTCFHERTWEVWELVRFRTAPVGVVGVKPCGLKYIRQLFVCRMSSPLEHHSPLTNILSIIPCRQLLPILIYQQLSSILICQRLSSILIYQQVLSIIPFNMAGNGPFTIRQSFDIALPEARREDGAPGRRTYNSS